MPIDRDQIVADEDIVLAIAVQDAVQGLFENRELFGVQFSIEQAPGSFSLRNERRPEDDAAVMAAGMMDG